MGNGSTTDLMSTATEELRLHLFCFVIKHMFLHSILGAPCFLAIKLINFSGTFYFMQPYVCAKFQNCISKNEQQLYSCGLSTATIEYLCPSMCLYVCVCLSVCVCLYTITKKIMVMST